jgi:hypothetical protein
MIEINIPNRDLVTDLANHYIYRLENPDWGQLMIALYDYGFTSGQVYDIMQSIREEGVV